MKYLLILALCLVIINASNHKQAPQNSSQTSSPSSQRKHAMPSHNQTHLAEKERDFENNEEEDLGEMEHTWNHENDTSNLTDEKARTLQQLNHSNNSSQNSSRVPNNSHRASRSNTKKVQKNHQRPREQENNEEQEMNFEMGELWIHDAPKNNSQVKRKLLKQENRRNRQEIDQRPRRQENNEEQEMDFEMGELWIHDAPQHKSQGNRKLLKQQNRRSHAHNGKHNPKRLRRPAGRVIHHLNEEEMTISEFEMN